jgi:hypothetical protein
MQIIRSPAPKKFSQISGGEVIVSVFLIFQDIALVVMERRTGQIDIFRRNVTSTTFHCHILDLSDAFVSHTAAMLVFLLYGITKYEYLETSNAKTCTPNFIKICPKQRHRQVDTYTRPNADTRESFLKIRKRAEHANFVP